MTEPLQYKKYVMKEEELQNRLDRIKAYNDYQIEAKQPHHCLTERQLAQQLVDWGHEPKRAKDIGLVPPPSKFLAAIKVMPKDEEVF